MTIAEKISRAKADYDAVYEAGKNAGGGGGQGSYDEGYVAGKEAVTEEIAPINAELEQTLYGADTGGKSFYDEFWDACQDNGNRTQYSRGFYGISWNDVTFNPKYDIVIVGDGTTAFGASGIIDTKKSIDITKATNSLGLFSDCYKLKIIRKLIIAETTPIASNVFSWCTNIESITIEGVIGTNGLALQHSPKLSRASIESIINALSTNTTGLSITLSKTAVDNAFTDDEWSALIGTRLNWTISLI